MPTPSASPLPPPPTPTESAKRRVMDHHEGGGSLTTVSSENMTDTRNNEVKSITSSEEDHCRKQPRVWYSRYMPTTPTGACLFLGVTFLIVGAAAAGLICGDGRCSEESSGSSGGASRLIRGPTAEIPTAPLVEESPLLPLGDPPSINASLPVVSIAALLDFQILDKDLLEFTVELINDHTDGWYDDVLTDAVLNIRISDSGCNQDVAVREYMDLMRSGPRPHAVLGARCSGASMALARLCAVENVPILSPASTSVKLSDEVEYPTFSRLQGPDDNNGQVGALIALLRSFGWDRVTVIGTDTQYTRDKSLEFSWAWRGSHTGDDPFTGEIFYTNMVKLNETNHRIDQESVRNVLNGVPVDKPSINSRVIVLFAHQQHAYEILKVAQQLDFQPDSIWVGGVEWISTAPVDDDYSWMPPVPGYLGLAPYRNLTSPQYTDFLTRFQQYQIRKGLLVSEQLEDVLADHIVDGILSLALALSTLPPDDRLNGFLVSQALRKVEFDGISGPVSFLPNGDRKDPKFTVTTLPSPDSDWVDVGFATPSMARVDPEKVCFAGVGCGSQAIPDDEYAATAYGPLSIWVWVVLGGLCLLWVLVAVAVVRNLRSPHLGK